MTSMPACLALSIEGTIALESLGRDQDALGAGRDQVLDRLHLGLVVAVLLAGERSAAARPASVAACCAPSFIFTKNGLVSVLVIRPTIGWSPESPELDPPLLPHALTTSADARPHRAPPSIAAPYL